MDSAHPPQPSAVDTLRFVGEALTLQGALVERDGDTAFAVCPADVARSLGISEEVLLASGEDGGALAVGFGTPLFEQLVERSKEATPTVYAVADIDPPRPAQARRLAERFVVRNGVFEVLEVTAGRAIYSVFWLAWTAECDDRYDGLLRFGVAEEDGAEAHAVLVDLITPRLGNARVAGSDDIPPAPESAERIAACVTRRASRALDGPLAPLAASLARRKRRDHDRIVRYFADLARDAVAGKRRARVDAAALDEKIRHFAAERDAKLTDLDVRFTLRASVRPAALLRVEIPVVRAQLRLRRRKNDREIVLRLAAGAPDVDRPACESCLLPLRQPALCDGALHLLCEACAPEVHGRLKCRLCGGQ